MQKTIKKGIVLSDLHLFSRRSKSVTVEQLYAAVQQHDFVVLNGDIIDFKWSVLPTTKETINQSVALIRALCAHNPQCQLYFVMGNHDELQSFGDALDCIHLPNFSWQPAFLQLGNHLFIHGDLPLARKNPFQRHLKADTSQKKIAYHLVYDMVVALRIHRLVVMMHRDKRMVRKVHHSLVSHNASLLREINHVYFGHTHAPFSHHTVEAITYYNTGSAIKHLQLNMVKVEYEQ